MADLNAVLEDFIIPYFLHSAPFPACPGLSINIYSLINLLESPIDSVRNFLHREVVAVVANLDDVAVSIFRPVAGELEDGPDLSSGAVVEQLVEQAATQVELSHGAAALAEPH